MTASMKCHHPQPIFAAECWSDTDGRMFMHMTASCEFCGAKFRFLGIDHQLEDIAAPTVDQTATAIILPMVAVA